MSIVGPRPHALAHNEFYKNEVESYMQRHKVKPGITGWAQVNGYRGETDTLEKMEKRVEHDLWYIDNWSLTLDLRIILKTIYTGFFNRSEEHTSELQSLMRISYAVFCLKKKKYN